MPTIPVPVPASVMVDRELARKKKPTQEKGNILTGCREIDEYVLLGGFQRGSVVGVSSEDDEMGVLVGFLPLLHSEKAPHGFARPATERSVKC